MKTRNLRNEDVIIRFFDHAHGYSHNGNLSTDGMNLWSYRLLIAKWVYNPFEQEYHVRILKLPRSVSVTTSRHYRELYHYLGRRLGIWQLDKLPSWIKFIPAQDSGYGYNRYSFPDDLEIAPIQPLPTNTLYFRSSQHNDQPIKVKTDNHDFVSVSGTTFPDVGLAIAQKPIRQLAGYYDMLNNQIPEIVSNPKEHCIVHIPSGIALTPYTKRRTKSLEYLIAELVNIADWNNINMDKVPADVRARVKEMLARNAEIFSENTLTSVFESLKYVPPDGYTNIGRVWG